MIFGYVFIVFYICVLSVCSYEVPKVTVQALKPKGIRASIPDAPKISLFTFNGNINSPIEKNDVGLISGEVIQATNGRWTFEDPDVQLKVGDVINYYVFVSVDSVGYLKDGLVFRVEALEEKNSNGNTNNDKTCEPTVTKISGGGKVCAGQVVFEDNFDSLNEDMWQIQHFIPMNHPEFPFVSYQRLPSPNATVSVSDGVLKIRPLLQQDQAGFTKQHIYSGSLNLMSGCTTSTSNECNLDASGANILPPIVSGRVSQWISFKYGTVHIRAKLPKGDWIYPEILLEPFRKKYGNLNYASGVMKIAAARGNLNLRHNGFDISNKVLYGGVIMSSECRKQLLFVKTETSGKIWSDDFHTYTILWTPDNVTLSVDAQEWAWISPRPGHALRDSYKKCDDVPQNILATGSNLAPFDDFFSITLGVSVGGITEFDDGVVNSITPKPWINNSAKAKLRFWQDMESWYPTWTDPELLIDYIKIIAL